MSHKMTIEVPSDIYNRLTKHVPWGTRQRVILQLIKLLAESVERDGAIVVGALMADRFSLVWNPEKDDPDAST